MSVIVCMLSMMACTKTTEEVQYSIDNRLQEDIIACYTCADEYVQESNKITIISIQEIIPAGHNKRLLHAEELTWIPEDGGFRGPMDTFGNFCICDTNGDTLLVYDRENSQSIWDYQLIVEQKGSLHRHTVMKYTVIVNPK